MKPSLICYDLDKPGQDYSNLTKTIEALGAWLHNLDSTWIVMSDLEPKVIRDQLSEHMDSNDKLFVVDIGGKASAWKGFSKKGSEWLKNHI